MIRFFCILLVVVLALAFQPSVSNAGLFGCPCQKAPKACAPAACAPSAPMPKACAPADCASVGDAAKKCRCHPIARLVGKVVAAPVKAVKAHRCDCK